MKCIATFIAAMSIIAAVAGPALAADCVSDTRYEITASMSKAPLEAGILSGVRLLLAKPRYFEDPEQGGECARPILDHPLYPGIPVKECTYQHLGLSGWVMVANPGAEVLSKWVFNACAEMADAKTCAVRLTAQVWCASQFVFPVTGNWIQADPSQKTQGVNTAVLHGVVITRPAWLPEKGGVTRDVQKQRLASLALREGAYAGLAGRVSLPTGLTPEAYIKGAELKDASALSGASSCSALAPRAGWLAASRVDYNTAWRTGRNPMFDAAARVLMSGDQNGPACG